MKTYCHHCGGFAEYSLMWEKKPNNQKDLVHICGRCAFLYAYKFIVYVLGKQKGGFMRTELLRVEYQASEGEFNQEIDRVMEALNGDEDFEAVQIETSYTCGTGTIVLWIDEDDMPEGNQKGVFYEID